MAVNEIRLEADGRQNRQSRLAEEAETLNIPFQVIAVGSIAAEISLVVDKIIMDAVMDILHDTDIFMIGELSQIHIETGYIVKVLTVLPRNTHIFRNDHTHIKFLFVQHFREGADNIRQSACFNKRIAFRSHKQNVSHNHFSVLLVFVP